ncbi:hypothetical protein MJD09_17605 [bacterium]|nr:hypothetical protein [bacterium]
MNIITMVLIFFATIIFFLALLSLLLGFRRKAKARYFHRLEPEDAAELSRRVLSKYPSHSTIFILAGEFNYKFYEIFVPHLYEIIDKKKLKVKVIGGPRISVENDKCKNESDPDKVNMILGAAMREKIQLFLKEGHRENRHFILCNNSDKIALVEEPHAEHEQRGTSLIYNSKVRCDNLRHRFKKILKEEKLLPVDSNTTCEKLQSRFKTLDEFAAEQMPEERYSHLPVGS